MLWWNAWLPTSIISMLTLLAAKFTQTLQRFQQYDPGWRLSPLLSPTHSGVMSVKRAGWLTMTWNTLMSDLLLCAGCPGCVNFHCKVQPGGCVALGSHWAAHRWIKQIFTDHSSREYFSGQGHCLQVSQTSVGCWLRKQLELGPTPLKQFRQYPAPGPKLDVREKNETQCFHEF